MNAPISKAYTVCPHDCPSTCALEVDVLSSTHIGRVRGSKDNTYTAGVICAKVARYAERVHHPDRLTKPLIRTGPKGSGEFREATWDEAMELTAARINEVEAEFGPEAVWPYYYAGTMGLVMRDGINRWRHAKGYSRMHGTFCTPLAQSGFMAGTGRLAGVDPREMAKSDVVVIWGTNPVNTQVNVMTHVMKARKERKAKIVAIDVYRNETIKQADMGLILKPGTDAALACAVMHIAFRDGYADRAYMEKYTDDPQGLEEHLKTRTPEWAAEITGLSVEEIEAFAKLVGTTQKTFFRLGYGFTRGRNGSASMHAAVCVPTVLGSWQYEGGGCFYNNGQIYNWDRSLIEGLDAPRKNSRILDQSRLGPILLGEGDDLGDGPPVKALFVQSTNPAMVAPELNKVHAGLKREDLFVCVHEQFMTETAKFADVVLPATMFLEHTDLYQGGGHQHILLGPKVIDAPGECRSNHDVIVELARRTGAEHRGFDMTPEEIIDWTLTASGWQGIESLRQQRWFDVQPDFDTAHYLNGFGHADGKFHFHPTWDLLGPKGFAPKGWVEEMPTFPDYWGREDKATDEHPFRMTTSPARSFLNSSFTETPSSVEKEQKPTVKIGAADAERLGIEDGQLVRLSNRNGTVRLHAEIFDGLVNGVVVVESVWPNAAFVDGIGINALTSAQPGAPIGGGLFHDTAVNVEAA